jgi:hypothetical protein
VKKGGVKPGHQTNVMRETRSNANSPMRTHPKFMTTSAKHKGGK